MTMTHGRHSHVPRSGDVAVRRWAGATVPGEAGGNSRIVSGSEE